MLEIAAGSDRHHDTKSEVLGSATRQLTRLRAVWAGLGRYRDESYAINFAHAKD